LVLGAISMQNNSSPSGVKARWGLAVVDKVLEVQPGENLGIVEPVESDLHAAAPTEVPTPVLTTVARRRLSLA